MRTIVHLSDVHFGRVDATIVEPLIAAVHAVAPDVVVLSGDLTQRAKPHQFEEARRFLEALPKPQIVVPGNHDVPLYDLTSRFFSGLGRYRRYITDDLMPFHSDEEIAVVGVNTARSLTFKGGRINRRQVLAIRRYLCPLPDETVKIVVTHHPFDLPERYHPTDLLRRAPMALRMLAECGADLFLAGHMHIGYVGSTAARYKINRYAALVIQAGTATSTRGRGEPNSFNIIRTAHPLITVERLSWQPETLSFSLAARETYHHTDEGWQREDSSRNAVAAAG